MAVVEAAGVDVELGTARHHAEKFCHLTWTEWKLLCCVVAVLALAINGGAVLPLPGAFASTGIICATVLMVVVALANVYTNDILLWQAHGCRRHDYETLSEAIAGPWWKFLTEVGLIVLMVGTLISGIQQIGESCASGISYLEPDYSGPFVEGSGRLIMAIAVVAVCAPLVFLTGLKQLETAGDIGIVINQVLIITILVNAITHGMPFVGRKGEFEVVGFTSLSNVLSLLGTYSYVFYIQPFSMAMLEEMPRGKRSVQILSWGTSVAILGTGVFVYYIAGFFGAGWLGAATIDAGNILDNDLGGNGKAQGALNIFYTVYLILSMPPFEYVTRHSMMKWWDSLARRFSFMDIKRFYRKIILAFLIYGFSTGIAVAIPGKSAKVITVTGSVGSGWVCYVVPVINHFALYFGWAKCMRYPEGSEGVTSRSTTEAVEDSARPGGNSPSAARSAASSAMLAHDPIDQGERPIGYDLYAASMGGKGKELALEQPEILEDEIYCYPSFAKDGLTLHAAVVRILTPLVVVAVGIFVAVAALVTINDA